MPDLAKCSTLSPRAGSYFTLGFEIYFPVLVWIPRLRWTMVLCAVLLHTGIALCMGLVTFSLMMLVAVLSFIPGSLVRDYIGRLGHFSLLEPSYRTGPVA